MPRTLPWLKGGGSTTITVAKPSSSRTITRERTPKRRRLSTPPGSFSDLDDDNTTGVSTPQRRARLNAARTPSTSPPPAPPDQQEAMHDGYSADDAWVMVEDEFLATAQLYTSHLHHAEYQRLKALAAKRQSSSSILRPVNGRSSAEGKKMIESAEKTERIAAGLRKAVGTEEDEQDDPWAQDARLAPLMRMSPMKAPQMLKAMGPGRARTRAAAGLGAQSERSTATKPSVDEGSKDVTQVRSTTEVDGESKRRKIWRNISLEEEDYDDDDLDAPAPVRLKFSSTASQRNEHRLPASRERDKPAITRPANTQKLEKPTEVSHRTTDYLQEIEEAPTSLQEKPRRRPASSRYTSVLQDGFSLPSVQERPRRDRPDHSQPSALLFQDDLVPSRYSKGSGASVMLARRRTERKQEREDKEVIEIPTFL